MAYLWIFAGGMAGSLHCVGMCGGFPLAVALAAFDRGCALAHRLHCLRLPPR